MRFYSIVFAAIALVTPTFAGPTHLLTVEKFAGETSGRHIVKLKEDASKGAILKTLGDGSRVTHDWEIFNGFAGYLDADTLNALRASPDVEHISEDGIMHTFVHQTNAPWGLSRIGQATWPTNQNPKALNFSYVYDETAGQGVDVYIIDTGVYTAHSQFGGRAKWGATFGGYPNADDNGHGTHVAGTVAGSQYGVAKKANIIAVKVLDKNGSGYISNIILGLNHVSLSAKASNRSSIASMSLGGGTSLPLDSAASALVSQGIHVTVAAGNFNTDAKDTSPARAAGVTAVGASTIADARAPFSNYGRVVKFFAPGQDIISSWIGSPNATNSISGTSMATPHVAGLVAYLISKEGIVTPAAMAARITELSVKGVLRDIPFSTVNELVQNGNVGGLDISA